MNAYAIRTGFAPTLGALMLLIAGCGGGAAASGGAGGDDSATSGGDTGDTTTTGGDGGASSTDSTGAGTSDGGGSQGTGGGIVQFVPGAAVSTLAGSAESGDDDGTGAMARFDNPVNVAIAPDGNLRVADYDGGKIRVVTPAGVVTTLTDQGLFARPYGLAFAADGTLFVETDWDNKSDSSPGSGSIWRVNGTTGVATIVVHDVGLPRGLAGVSDGSLVVADPTKMTVSVLDPGSKQLSSLAGKSGAEGYAEGSGSTARFASPYGLAVRSDGSVLVADQGNNVLRIVTMDGQVSTFAGTGEAGLVDADRLSARFDRPQAVAIDAAGEVFVSDAGNHRIRRIDAAGNVLTLAGDGAQGFRDGPADAASFYGQEGLAVTDDGKTIYVADGNAGDGTGYHRIRKITLP